MIIPSKIKNINSFLDELKMLGSVTVFSDMDGCIAVFNKEASLEDTYGPSYFRNLEMDEWYDEFLKGLEERGIKVVFLSAAYGDKQAADKRLWLNEHGYENNKLICVPYGVCKREYIQEHYPELLSDLNVLIDDFTKNLLGWQTSVTEDMPYFVGIKYINAINDTRRTWKGIRIGLADPDISVMEVTGIITALLKSRAA